MIISRYQSHAELYEWVSSIGTFITITHPNLRNNSGEVIESRKVLLDFFEKPVEDNTQYPKKVYDFTPEVDFYLLRECPIEWVKSSIVSHYGFLEYKVMPFFGKKVLMIKHVDNNWYYVNRNTSELTRIV